MNTIDLFAGCGGLSLGFENAGFCVKAAFDNWKPAIEVYQANFTHPIIDLDLSQDFAFVDSRNIFYDEPFGRNFGDDFC